MKIVRQDRKDGRCGYSLCFILSHEHFFLRSRVPPRYPQTPVF
ncbi:MAG: hypothetical protein OJF52_002566 [Nitrospira sp.]|nr:MAG: hypothetical protein OJF52_002566 [Nitrospira sp.]